MAAYTTIDDPGLYFNTILWTGTDTARSITGYGFQPDLAWVKHRSAAYNHVIFDAVRTAGSDKDLTPVTNAAEGGANAAAYGYVSAFVSDGISLGEGTTNDSYVNTTDIPYVGWCWKAGTTSGIATSGSESITPSGYSFNQTAGFSIIAYTGSTRTSDILPHGLGAAPGMIIVKSIDGAREWVVFNKGMNPTAPEDYYMALNDTYAALNNTASFNDTAADTVNFTIGTDAQINAADDFIAYLWAPKQGYSKFGSYEGNGNADGTFVYTGFRPAWIMTKSVDSTSAWHMFDNKREGYNVDNDALVADADSVEATTDMLDILSNGFKFRIATDPNVAETYIYAAFAEAPFVNSSGVPCNAR